MRQTKREIGSEKTIGQPMPSRAATKNYGTVSADRQKAMSGLEFVQGLADGTLPLNKMAETLRYDVSEAASGRVVVTARPSEADLNPAGKQLMRIEKSVLSAATQPLFAHTGSRVIPASAAVAVEIDLILPPNTAPERVTHKIAYALKAGSELAPMIPGLEVDAPEVAINRKPAILIKPPVKGEGWVVSSGCCEPNIHRDCRNLRY